MICNRHYYYYYFYAPAVLKVYVLVVSADDGNHGILSKSLVGQRWDIASSDENYDSEQELINLQCYWWNQILFLALRSALAIINVNILYNASPVEFGG